MKFRPWESETGPLLAAALEAAGKGWAVFPLIPNTKRPITDNGFKDASTDEKTIREWWSQHPKANIGIATGEVSGVSVVDVDIKDGRQGEASAIKLGLTLHDTLTVRTTSGGWHYYFNHSDGFRSRQAVMPGIDTRGDGGYVVGAGSIIDGEMYDVANVGDVQEMPDSVLRITGERARAATGEAIPDSAQFKVDAGEVDRIRAALGHINADPYETWLTVGMSLYELAGGSQQMFVLWDWWSASSSKYDGATMSKRWHGFASERPDKVTEATFWHMAREAGYTEPGAEMIFVPESSNRIAVPYRELEHWRGPRRDEIELWRNSVISRGNMTLIAGPAKIGKSMLVQHLMMAAATGREFLSFPFRRPLKTLWVQAEIRKVYLKESRLEPAIESAKYTDKEMELFRDNFITTDRLDLEITTKREFNILAKVVAEVCPDVLVIDPAINFSSANENDARETKELLRAARQLARSGATEPEKEPALIIVHHTKKISDKYGVGSDPFELIRGSGAFRGYYDSGIMLLPDPSGCLAMYFETRNQRSPEPLGLKYNGVLAQFETADLAIAKDANGQYSAMAEGRAEQRFLTIVNYLASQREPYAVPAAEFKAEMSRQLNLGESQLKAVIKAATENAGGQVQTKGGGPTTTYIHSKYGAWYDAKTVVE